MRYILCYCCGRQRVVERLKKGVQLVCLNCGAKGPRVVNRRHIKWWMNTDERDGDDADEARHRLMGGLYWIVEQKGYRLGWAAWRFLRMFGRWPNGEASVGSLAPGNGLMDWIKRDNAAYAKRMREKEKSLTVERSSNLMSTEDWDVKL